MESKSVLFYIRLLEMPISAYTILWAADHSSEITPVGKVLFHSFGKIIKDESSLYLWQISGDRKGLMQIKKRKRFSSATSVQGVCDVDFVFKSWSKHTWQCREILEYWKYWLFRIFHNKRLSPFLISKWKLKWHMDTIYSNEFLMAEYFCLVIRFILKFRLVFISSVTQMYFSKYPADHIFNFYA